MKAFLATCFLLCATSAQAISDIDPPFTAGGNSIGERVMQLPEDSHAWFCTVFVANDDRQPIVRWFSDNPQLERLAASTHFSCLTPKSKLWPRYWEGTTDANGSSRGPLISKLPAVVLQKPLGDGRYQIVARFQGNSSHLDSAENLARALAACIRSTEPVAGHIFARPWNPNRPKPDCPDCRPKPKPYEPDPGPYDVQPKPLVPDIEPPEEVVEEVEAEERKEHTAEVAFAVAVFVLVLAFAYVKDRQAQTY